MIQIAALANRWLIGGLVAAVVAAGGALMAYSAGHDAGAAQVQAAWDAERMEALRARAEVEASARKREQELAAQAARQRQELRREINRLEQRHAAVVDSLRDRPEARADSGGVPEGAVSGVGCTGAGLARLDAELLTGYAAAAARQQAALNACVAAYNEVREQINARD